MINAMIRLNLHRLMRLRGVAHPHSYLVNHGFSRQEASSLLRPSLKRLELSMIHRLCKLFKCLPNDIFGYDGQTEPHLLVLNKPMEKPVVEETDDFTQEEMELFQRMMGQCIAEIRKGRSR